MLFNSYVFILLFFPLCLLGFYALKRTNDTWAKLWLIGFSLWFYGYFNIRYLCIMVFSIAFNYGMHCLIKKEKKKKKFFLITAITGNLMLLFYFKYFDFFIENINRVFGTSFLLQNILLPLGISFFTFQQISFLADTYRGELEECNLIDYVLFVVFFPQLIAGPIVTHEEMLPQFKNLKEKKWDEEQFVKGLFVFVLGLAKKVLIADTFGKAVDIGYGNISVLSSVDAVLVMLFYTLQLYFDFSGYCDMAIGIGNMMGITIPVNFNSPYKAANIVEFWKRWHITLSRFFTKNIYIPLGGNRKGMARMLLNLLLIFIISGIWHGAGWNYVLWGIMHGVLYCITRFYMAIRNKEKPVRLPRLKRVTGVIFTFLYVNIAWIFFRADNIGHAFSFIKRMISGGIKLPAVGLADAFSLDEFFYVLKLAGLTNYPFSPYILMIVFTLVMLIIVFFGKNVHSLAKDMKMGTFSALVTAVLFVWCVISLSGVSTFLYFNF